MAILDASSDFGTVLAVVDLAFRSSPFYSRVLRDAGLVATSVQDMDTFRRFIPLTRQSDVARDPFAFLLPDSANDVRIVVSSSGTTGVPKVIFHNTYYAETKRQAHQYWGIPTPSSFLVAGRYGSLSYIIPNGCYRELGHKVAAFGLKHDPAFFLTALRVFSVNALRTIPSFALFLTTELGMLGAALPQLGVRHIVLSNHALGAREKAYLQAEWDCHVHQVYGSNEAGPIGVSCTSGEGFHINTKVVLVEVLDPLTGAPMAEGQCGEIVVTPLQNGVMPLLRYQQGDLGCLSSGQCTCGHSSPKLTLMGRENDLFCVGPMGLRIQLADCRKALSHLPELLGPFQVVLENSREHMEQLIFRCEVISGIGDGDREIIQQKARAHLQAVNSHFAAYVQDGLVGLQVEIVPPCSLPLTEEGKPKDWIIDRRDIAGPT